jgi:hypothetical protein
VFTALSLSSYPFEGRRTGPRQPTTCSTGDRDWPRLTADRRRGYGRLAKRADDSLVQRPGPPPRAVSVSVPAVERRAEGSCAGARRGQKAAGRSLPRASPVPQGSSSGSLPWPAAQSAPPAGALATSWSRVPLRGRLLKRGKRGDDLGAEHRHRPQDASEARVSERIECLHLVLADGEHTLEPGSCLHVHG